MSFYYGIKLNSSRFESYFCFSCAALSKDETSKQNQTGRAVIMDHYDNLNQYSKDEILSYIGYSDEYLNKLEPNGNIPSEKHINHCSGGYAVRK